ncbi:MAG: transposase, partial [candidate division NC10 bacterium]
RPGNTVAATGAVPFLRVCLAKVPRGLARSRLRVRADSGFFGNRVLEFLETAGVGYAIVAKVHTPIKEAAQACRFRPLGSGWEVGEFRYQAGTWPHARRCVVVRRPIPTDPVEAKQLTLFKDQRYAYHVLVTNLRTHPWRRKQRSQSGQFSSDHQYSWRMSPWRLVPSMGRPASVTLV